MRGTQEWIESVRKTGRWDQPRFWRNPAYLSISPWSHQEHNLAFAALRVIYPPDAVQRIFASSSDSFPWLAPLLMDPFRPDLSALLSLGFDAAHGRIDRHPDLAHRLRDDDYAGARLELRFLAAIERQGIRYEYEPYAKKSRRRAKAGGSHPNPDFRVHLGEWIVVDLKHMRNSQRSERSLKRFMLVQHGSVDNWQVIPAGIQLTDRYARLQTGGYSEDRLDRLAVKLHERARERANEMAALGLAKETIGGGLLRLDRTRRGAWGVHIGDPHDGRRIVGRLDEGVGQLPPGEKGVLVVEVSASDPLDLVVLATHDWMNHAKPELIGVVLLHEQWVPGAEKSLMMPLRCGASEHQRRCARQRIGRASLRDSTGVGCDRWRRRPHRTSMNLLNRSNDGAEDGD